MSAQVPPASPVRLQLNRAGHWVTVFERSDRIGGLLMYGIPQHEARQADCAEGGSSCWLKKGILLLPAQRWARTILQSNCLRISMLSSSAGEASQPRDLQVEGRNLKGIHFAVEYLKSTTKSLLDSNLSDGKYISAYGKDVLIIGGGDTGTDCVPQPCAKSAKASTSSRLCPGCPTSAVKRTPWPQFPRVFKEDYGQAEARLSFR